MDLGTLGSFLSGPFNRPMTGLLSKLRFMTTRPFRSPWTTDPWIIWLVDNDFKAAWENTIPASVLNECQEVKVEAFSDEEEILRDDEIRLGFNHLAQRSSNIGS